MERQASHHTRAFIDIARLHHNLHVLQSEVGSRPMWPAIKANAYGHGAKIIARELVKMGYRTQCVAHAAEAIELIESGIDASFIVLSAAMPEDAELFVAYGLQPVVCTRQMLDALSREAVRLGRHASVHLKIDTGMGRIGVQPSEAAGLLVHAAALPGVRVSGLMSHFCCADEADKRVSFEQIERFEAIRKSTVGLGIDHYHFANSAAIFDLPDSHLDAVRPGIALYGLAPSASIANPAAQRLKPVLSLQSRISFLKEVPAGRGLSYGHTFRTSAPALIATIPAGYGDGVRRELSNRAEVLVQGMRCPLVGQVTMDQSLIDVTALCGRAAIGDPVVLIGQQGERTIGADEIAAILGTINYEVVTGIAARVPRIRVERSLCGDISTSPQGI